MTSHPALPTRPISRRSMLQGSAGMAATAALIGGMTFPKSIVAQTPVGEIPPKELSGTAILSIPGEPLSFNLNAIADDNLWPIACNIYNSLFSLDNDFNVIMELATGYEVADDGMSITVTLNPLATWHDGEPVTAADVKWSLEAVVGEPTTFGSSLISALDTVDVVDDHTAVLNLNRASSSIIGFLSWYGVMIMPAHIYGDGSDWLEHPANMQPIGSGPFKFVSYAPGSTVELVANEAYFGEGPYLESAIYQIIPDPNTEVQSLLNGEIDVANVPSAQVPTLEANPDFVTAGKMYPSPIYLGFNTARAPLDNLDVRKAIAMGIDREQIVATALAGYGEIQTGFYPTVIEWASNPDSQAPAFDVEGANALLDSAGFPLDGDTRFKLQYYIFSSWQELADTATVIKEQLAAIGIEIEIVTLEFAAWEEQLRSGEFDMGSVGGFQGPDPANLAVRWGSEGSFNFWSFNNAEFDDLLLQGDSAPTPEERAPHYFAAQQIMADDLPGVLLVLQSYYTAWTSRLSGFWLDPNDPASNLVGMNRLTLTRLEG